MRLAVFLLRRTESFWPVAGHLRAVCGAIAELALKRCRNRNSWWRVCETVAPRLGLPSCCRRGDPVQNQAHEKLVLDDTLALLSRKLDDLDRLQAEAVPDPVTTAHIRKARSLLNRASGLVRKLHEQS